MTRGTGLLLLLLAGCTGPEDGDATPPRVRPGG